MEIQKKKKIFIGILEITIILFQQLILCMLEKYAYIIVRISKYSFYISVGLIIFSIICILIEIYRHIQEKNMSIDVIILSVGSIISSCVYVDFIFNIEKVTIKYPLSILPFFLSLLYVIASALYEKTVEH